ncbi:(2Fe-2S)-binding protein [Amycolatopsis taiwanensis]|uniref:(2Fe-2S)-binding protein n=1 Tax=Amycolatopsis taiwanensis TaxID=342230 RepID=A0A9W6RD17_9PSEU|nr:(2Fe-2S)-binding protein [Amycolatopsis taiwanensis]GLY71695.1 (2Fe-2S)-binding protein [Amycolatopsis taiwanensis]
MKINGIETTPPSEPDVRLIDYLRDELGLIGTKEGCGMGECGSCTVLLNGRPVCSCLVLAGQAADADIVTVEGVGAIPAGRAVRDALVANQAVQCGFCTAGVVVSATALLSEHPEPDGEQMRAALEGNLCRCTGYGAISRAIRSAHR